jgi:tetratricopeptide (TPR) repeat protein
MTQTNPPNTATVEEQLETLRQHGWPAAELTPAIALSLVKAFRERGNRQSAQEVLSRALAIHPNDAALLNEQGHVYAGIERHDLAALDSFDQALHNLQADQTDIRLSALVGATIALRRLRRFDEAAERLQEAIAVAGPTPSGELLLQQGWLSFYRKFYEQAFNQFTEAFTKLSVARQLEARVGLIASRQQLDYLNPFDNTNARLIVESWLTTHPSDEVSKALTKASDVLEALNLYPAALKNAELMLEVSPDKQKGTYFKIAALKWLRRYAQAARTYHDAPHELQTDSEIWNEWANVHYEQKLFPEAYSYYSGKALDRPDLTAEEIALKERLRTNAEAREWTIVSLRKMRRFDEARVKIDEALATIPEKLNFLCEQGFVFYAERDYDNAIKAFDRALKVDSYCPFALQWRVACLRKKKDFSVAETAIEDALKKMPYDTGLWEELGWVAFDQGKLADAVAAFDEAIKLDPYLLNRQFAKAEVLVRLNRSDDALEVYKKLDEQFPNDAEIAEQLCWFYIRAGELELAREQQIKVRQGHPNSVLGLNALGGCELAQRNYPAAEQAFRDALKIVDYEPQYYVNLALVLLRQVKSPGELSRSEAPKRAKLIYEAKEQCRAALKLDPFNARAYGCLGVIAFRQDAFLDAETYFLKSIELNPTEGSFIELASLYCQMGRYDEATTKLQDALKLNPKDARAYIELGNVAVAKEDNKEAVRLCREATYVEPKNSDTYRALAIALMRSDKYEEAEVVVRRALVTLAPNRPWRLNLLLAQILIRLGDVGNKERKRKELDLYEEALQYVNEARQATLPNADIAFHAGIVQHRLEDYSLAQKSFAECLKLNRHRFDAERCGRVVREAVKQQRRAFSLSQWFGVSLAIVCFVMLGWLWISYFSGHQRTRVEPSDAGPVTKVEYTVSETLFNVMTPILLGLMAIGALLPNLSKLKLPGFEAEVSEPKPSEPNISTGPRGDIGFGTSLPIVDPEPR